MISFADFADPSPGWRGLPDERVPDFPARLLDLLPIGVSVCDRDGLLLRDDRASAGAHIAALANTEATKDGACRVVGP